MTATEATTTGAGAPDAAELARRTIRRSDYVNCNQAFIDCRTPGSADKENYSIIGVGVSQSAAQVVNLDAPHGYNVGAAAMPHGITNNLHLHFTAEVFLNFRGDWLMRWGADGGDGEIVSREGDIVSMPPWVFRGFTNVGADDGWLFTILGFDRTGGIIWGPSVLAEAATHGLYLTERNEMVDVQAGQEPPGGVELITPMSEPEIARLRQWSVEQMRRRVTTQQDLAWSSRAFLCAGLPGGRAELASVIGYGMTEDRDQEPRITYPHNFNVSWLRAEPGEGLLRHRHAESQVLIPYRGQWRVTVGLGEDEAHTEIGAFDTLSVPADAWRRLEVVSDEPGLLVVVNGGDGRVRLEWDDAVRQAARAEGLAQDAAGYVAPWSVVRTSVPDD